MVSLAEERLARNRKAVFVTAQLPQRVGGARRGRADPARRLQPARTTKIEGAWRRLIFDFRTDAGDPQFRQRRRGRALQPGRRGDARPHHPHQELAVLVAPRRRTASSTTSARRARGGACLRRRTTDAYFARNNARCGGTKKTLDPLPRVVLVPGLGLFGLGRSEEGRARSPPISRKPRSKAITDAEAIGRFESICEADMFDMEYWSLEQAKLGKAAEKPLAGQVAVDHRRGRRDRRGDRESVRRGRRRGRAARPRRRGRGEAKAKAIGGAALAVACDVTDAASVRAAFDQVVEAFGGVDIVVSNAGAAWQGRIGEVDEAVLRKSFELNFFAHQRVAQNAVRIMLAQGTGGCLLFNVSKQAVNPGPNFGPYGLPKAATLFLVRQYALDYGADGIRANAVNADRIRSGLLTDDFIAERAKARGVSENDYMSGNLLGREVTADDVAQAFLRRRWRSRPPPTSPPSTAAISQQRMR